MAWLRNRSIGVKLGILSAVPLVLLILITAFNFIAFKRIDVRYSNAIDNYAAHASDIAVFRANLQGIQKDVLKIILLEDSDAAKIKDVKEDIVNRRQENGDLLREFEKTQNDDKTKTLLNRLESMLSNMRALQDRVVETGSLGTNEANAEAAEFFFSQVESAAQEFNSVLVELSRYLIERTDAEQVESTNFSNSTSATGAAVATAATVITLILSFFVARLITKPINTMKETIANFSAGDLTVAFDTSGRDAIAQMGHELDKMANTLRGVMDTIKNAGKDISDSSQDFSAMAEETNASVEEFRANVDEMNVNLSGLASASEEVNASVEEVAAGAQTTAEKGTDIARKVDNAMSAGDSGMSAVRSVVEGIGRVAESSAASTSAVLELGNRTRQIQSFVTQIGSIADQTNLLALNAAIEAARAGEAGRGFAVVAEEVRKLAEDSNVAAKNIADLAGEITSDLDRIVNYAQENTSDSNKAKDLSSETEEAISNMITYLRDIASSTQDLAAVAEEQAASSEEIAEAVQSMSTKINDTASASENIRTSVTEVAAASEKVAEGSENLSRLAGNLQDELSYFNLGDEDGAVRKKGLKSLPAGKTGRN
ncbi:MAG: methyl-accepting chemotaxis protein [Synergistaceae bacterium]|jgi:methyl-accepting chemotaxis protein|nr:methyl-accepting chemotaxis protein [Synergistaceae bacterium]